MAQVHRHRFILVALAGVSLIAALWAGIIRLGWNMPVPIHSLPLAHGPLMVVGFLGVLIGLERAVAFGHPWPFAVPLFAALSAATVLLGLPAALSASLALIASVAFIAVFAALFRRYPAEHFVVMALSALCWGAGNLLWLLGVPLFLFVPWWVAFLVFMIAGERLELSRVRRPSTFVRSFFHASVALSLLGLVYSFFDGPGGIRLAGVGFLCGALWLLRYDLAWHALWQSGLPRFMSVCLLPGYGWLAVGGWLWVAFAPLFHAGPRYDAMLHSVFLGFAFSMIFAHAPVIFPSIINVALPFRRLFYAHWLLLHVSLALRIGGDLLLWMPAQRWGGLLNAAAVLLFLINNVRAVILGTRVKGAA